MAPRLPPQSGTLLGVRNVGGYLIENVTFDAAYRAPRCLTSEIPQASFTHLIGIRDSTFRDALRELMHLGGELPLPGLAGMAGMFGRVTDPDTGQVRFTSPSLHWNGDQDLLGFRMERCVLDTGDPSRWADGLRAWEARQRPEPELAAFFEPRPLCGFVFRSGQATLTEVVSCSFKGPASPMAYFYAGNTSFHQCFFSTSRTLAKQDPTVPLEATLDALDVFLDFSPMEPATGAVSAVQAMPVCRLKNVVSRSPRLLSTFRRLLTNASAVAAVELISVEHLPVIGSDEPLLPAILWAGGAFSRSRLVLMGCRFHRPRSGSLTRQFPEPILADLWTWDRLGPGESSVLTRAADALRREVNAWQGGGVGPGGAPLAASPSSRGHIVDLGTKVQGATTNLVAVSAATWNRLRLLSRTDLEQAGNLELVERYTVLSPR